MPGAACTVVLLCLLAGCRGDQSPRRAPPTDLLTVFHDLPAWSPDSVSIAFWRLPENVGETPRGVWILNLRDSSMKYLIGGLMPRWAPDGRSLVVSINAGIAVVDLATGTAKMLVSHGTNWSPSWSPDGQWIVFDRTAPADSFGLWVVSTSGLSGLRRVSADLERAGFPAWSPDGNWIAFSRQEEGSIDWRIWVVRPDGTGLRRLTYGPRDLYPAWSPDSKRLAYSSRQGITLFDMATLENHPLAGTAVSFLASDPGVSWSPDGRFLVYNKEYLWIIEADGSNNRQLTGPEGVIGRRAAD
jgi:Tol biopolymer transport system component